MVSRQGSWTCCSTCMAMHCNVCDRANMYKKKPELMESENESAGPIVMVSRLLEIIRMNNIPEDARIMSDSGWECCATDCNGVYYNRAENTLVLTQGKERYYEQNEDWKRIDL